MRIPCFNKMGSLKEDIDKQSQWIVKAFGADGIVLDYSLKSFIEIDKFISKHSSNGVPKRGGRLAHNLGAVVFSIAAYVAVTIIRLEPGAELVTDDDDPEGELTFSVRLPGGGVIWPCERVLKRLKNGIEDSVYYYGYVVLKDFVSEEFQSDYWEQVKSKNRWWKFWV